MDNSLKNLFKIREKGEYIRCNTKEIICISKLSRQDKKIKCFLSEKEEYKVIAEKYSVAMILCGNTLTAFGRIAAFHKDKIAPVVIGVTGSNGKTTTKELIHRVVSLKYNTLKNEKNYNNEIGVPFTLLRLKREHKAAVIEMGMNHPGEIERLAKIVRPEMAVVTGIGEGHLEFLGSVEGVAHAKAEIIDGMKEGSLLILNKDADYSSVIEKKAYAKGLRVKTYGLSSDTDFHPDSYSLFENSVQVVLKGEKIDVPVYGKHNLYNVLAALAVAEEFSIDMIDVKKTLADFVNVDGRSKIIHEGFILIDDTYNSNPLSLRFALESSAEIFTDRRKIAVFGDMKELGDQTEELHFRAGQWTADNNFSLLIATGEMAGAYRAGALDHGMNKDQALVFGNKNEIIKYLTDHLDDKSVVLVKGSRSTKMEEVVAALTN